MRKLLRPPGKGKVGPNGAGQSSGTAPAQETADRPQVLCLGAPGERLPTFGRN